MNTLKPFAYRLPQNLMRIFHGYNLMWHLTAIVATYILVVSDFDWIYFEHTRAPILFDIFIPAALIGFVVPIFGPLVLLIFGSHRKDGRMLNAGYAVAQSAALGWIVSSTYKAFTGRAHPEGFAQAGTLTDLTHQFQFGFMKAGIFWGWPSSHTAVAFAVASTAAILFPSKWMRIVAAIYAFYIGIGVSLTIHWFSDFVAGAIIGTVVGLAVASVYQTRLATVSVSHE